MDFGDADLLKIDGSAFNLPPRLAHIPVVFLSSTLKEKSLPEIPWTRIDATSLDRAMDAAARVVAAAYE